MKKSNVAILVALFVASIVHTYLWLVGGYHLTDYIVIDAGPLILWWIALVVVSILFVVSDRRHLIESRTVYIGGGKLYNPTKGLVDATPAPLSNQVARTIADIKHSSRGQAFPEADAFAPELIVRTTDYKQAAGEPAVWKGEIVEASQNGRGNRWTFANAQELDTLLQAC